MKERLVCSNISLEPNMESKHNEMGTDLFRWVVSLQSKMYAVDSCHTWGQCPIGPHDWYYVNALTSVLLDNHQSWIKNQNKIDPQSNKIVSGIFLRYILEQNSEKDRPRNRSKLFLGPSSWQFWSKDRIQIDTKSIKKNLEPSSGTFWNKNRNKIDPKSKKIVSGIFFGSVLEQSSKKDRPRHRSKLFLEPSSGEFVNQDGPILLKSSQVQLASTCGGGSLLA